MKNMAASCVMGDGCGVMDLTRIRYLLFAIHHVTEWWA